MNSLPEKPIRLSICSYASHLPAVRGAVEKVCEQIGFDVEATGGVVLSVDEALANIIKHAYEGQCGEPIEIEILPTSDNELDGIEIRIRDYGQYVDPAQIKSRDLEDVRPGGLGVHIMNQCMDSVQYAPADGGGTLLTMMKRTSSISPSQEATK